MAEDKLHKVRQTVKQIRDGFGPPRKGFDDYFNKCKQIDFPTLVPEFCRFYLTPDGAFLHELMLQPFYDSRVMKVKDTDVLISSFPKSGTTWVQELAYLIVHDADFEKAKSAPTEVRVPFLEMPVKGIQGLNNSSDPRLMKTHLFYDFLPQEFHENKNAKIIYIIRNPKDTAVSYYNFLTMVGYVAYSGTFENFVHKAFDFDNTGVSNYSKSIKSYWNIRHQDNVLILFYEELLKDLKSNIEKMAKFLGKTLTDKQVTMIAEYCSFGQMSKNPMANYSHGGAGVKHPDSKTTFMRKGTAGDWINHFTPEMSEKMDQFVENHFKGTGIVFSYGI